MTMPQDAAIPKVGDRVLFGRDEFEIRAVIVEEGSVILVEAEQDPQSSRVWVLRDATFTLLYNGVWQATQYSSFEEAGDPGEEKS